MKKLYFSLLIFSFFTTVNAQIVNIPDANFKAKLLEANTTNFIAKNLLGAFFKIDTNNDGQIQESEALNVSYLDARRNQISSLVGIEKFTNLKILDSSSNLLSSLDVSKLVNLTALDCSFNQLSTLDVTPLVKLTLLVCSYNHQRA